MPTNHVAISREVLGDSSLSWEARGLLGYLLSMEQDAPIRVPRLTELSPNGGRERVQRILRELESHGHVQLVSQPGAGARVEWKLTRRVDDERA